MVGVVERVAVGGVDSGFGGCEKSLCIASFNTKGSDGSDS